MEFITRFTKKLLVKMLGFLIWLLPTILITNKLYIIKYGDYNWKLNDINFIAEFIFTDFFLFTFLVFSFFILSSYFIETFLLPIILSNIKKSATINNVKSAENFMKNVTGENVINKISEFIKEKGEGKIYSELCYIPTGLALWSTYLLLIDKLIWSFVILIISILIVYTITIIVNYVKNKS